MTSYSAPCAACKFLRRKCISSCTFAPYFPAEEPQKFFNVHKVFGASNVTKLLNELLPHQREDAVNSLAYEAEARVRDPVYGCVGAISVLQTQVSRLQKELDAANADLIRYAASYSTTQLSPMEAHNLTSVQLVKVKPPQMGGGSDECPARSMGFNGGGIYQPRAFAYPLSPLHDIINTGGGEGLSNL